MSGNSPFVLNIAIVFSFFTSVVYAQDDTLKTIELNNVFITQTKPSFHSTSRDIIAITNTEMKEKGAQSLSEAIATMPGISQLTTGAISKPVIRGVYGNRILVNIAGIQLEDQEWEDEHGLGISDIGIERVEVIKGPASLMYGSNAMGGVINIIDSGHPDSAQMDQDLNLKLFSNTYGIGAGYGLRKTGKNSITLNAGIENHADYTDGKGNRVPNTRFALYNLNAGYIFQRGKWKSKNRILTAFNQFGFIADTSDIAEDQTDPRLSRKFDNAHHSVFFNMLSSANTFRLNGSTVLSSILGIQSNLRQEQERSHRTDLNLFLNTFTLNTSVQMEFNHHWSLTNGIAAKVQDNNNLGSRIIVPDATILEGSVYSYIRKMHHWGRITGNFETGLRYDHRQVTTVRTGSFNSASSEISPFSRGFNVFNGSVGESLIIRKLVIKFDLGTGFRGGNLAELSANGLHEGTPNWYIGNPALKVEQCFNIDFFAGWQIRNFFVHGSLFRNYFQDFIYLRPTGEEYFGFDIYRYEQTNAAFQGFETGIRFEKENLLSATFDYSYLDARRTDGTWLPLMPPNRLLFNGRYYIPVSNTAWRNLYINIGADYCESQQNTDIFERPTPDYLLFSAGAGVSSRNFRFILTCRNLTNQLYYDHLSRLKYYGLYDRGRSIVLNVDWQF